MTWRRPLGAALILFLAGCAGPADRLQREISRGGAVTLPPEAVELKKPLVIPPGTEVELTGTADSVLHAAPEFQGQALILCRDCKRVKMRGFSVEGAESGPSQLPVEAPPENVARGRHFNSNGILIDNGEDVEISGVRFRGLPGYAVVGAGSRRVKVENVSVSGGGSRNLRGKSNGSGGIVFEDGSTGIEVRNSRFEKISGHGISTAARPTAQRNGNLVFENNEFNLTGRSAIHVGSSNRVRVLNNRIKFAGYPAEVVENEVGAASAAISSSGKVDEGVIRGNRIEEVNGYCFYLNGFHDGAVEGNECVNRGKPEEYPLGAYGIWFGNLSAEMRSQLNRVESNLIEGMRLGGVFLVGSGHKILNNRFLKLNMAQCPDQRARNGCDLMPSEPGVVRAGVFIGDKAERPDPATGNVVEGNQISGYNMKANCVILADKVDAAANVVRGNTCLDVMAAAPAENPMSLKDRGTNEYELFKPSDMFRK